MRKVKGLLFTLAGALALGGLVSCGGNDANNYRYGELKISIPTGVIRTAGDIVALQKGFFEEEGVLVTGVNLQGPNALTALHTNSDGLDLLTLGFVPDVQAISNGYDNIRFIGGTAVEGGAIITRTGNANKYKDNNTIINFQEIENASLAFAVGEAAWVVTNEYLTENDPNYLNVKSSLDITNLADAQTVAQQIGLGNFEVGFLPLEYAYLYQDSFGVEIIAEAGQLIPEYVCCRQATSQEKLEEKYDAFVAYEKARIRAWEYINNENNREEIVRIVADYIGKEDDYVRNYLFGGITKWSVDPNTKGISTYKDALKNAGVLANDIINITDYVDTTAYKAALDALIAENPTNVFYQEKLQLFRTYNTLN